MTAPCLSAASWPLIGHERQVSRLRRLVAGDALPPAILISGPKQVGRRTLALLLAQAASCPNVSNDMPCGTCITCHRIWGMTHPDVRYWSIDRQRIESGSKSQDMDDESGPAARQVLTIDSVRKVIGWTAFRPTELARTVIILDDVETMVDSAQQAMLKMLEDAADYVTVILLVTNSAQILDTVRSRCMDIPLQLVPTRTIVDGIPGPDAESIAALSAGRPGWAIQARGNDRWLAQEIVNLENLESWLLKPALQRLIEAYTRGSEFTRKRSETYTSLERIQLIWRDCALVAAGMGEYAFDQRRAEKIALRGDANMAGWHRALTATRACVRDLNGNIRPRLAMQHMVNQWPTLS